MEAKHTQTPWHVGEPNMHHEHNETIGIRSHDDWVVADVWQDCVPGKANAEFIVRAANAHDDLMKAASQAYARLLALGEYTGRHTAKGQQELCALRDAIALATGASDYDVQTQHEELAAIARAGA